MPKVGSAKHEEALRAKVAELEADGYRVVLLNGKSPDGIAIKDGKVLAVEILGRTIKIRKDGRKKHALYGGTMALKVLGYSMFDGVVFGFWESDNYRARRTQ